ncbi:MAG: DUF4167 domain-containing protein [Alphaproteobacteria bacterium]|nr:DUF4167 domain-containing protein [Alphaproteobacteria bacterium]
MKQNSRNRRNGHFGNRNTRPTQTIYRNTVLESTGPCGKLRGTPLQLAEKYQAAAKDALVQNDTILAENFSQYADHYMHLQNQAIENEKVAASYRASEQSAPAEEVENKEESSEEQVPLSTENLSVPVQEMQFQEDTTQDPE